MRTIFKALLFSLLVCCLCFAADEAKPADDTKPADKPASDVAVTVNGQKIMEADVAVAVEEQFKTMASRGMQLPPQFMEQYKSKIREQMIDRLVVEKLMAEKMKTQGIAFTDEQIEGKLKEMISQQQPPLSIEDFKALIEAHGKSIDEVKENIRMGMGVEELIKKANLAGTDANEADAKKFYDQNKQQFDVQEQVKASHILIPFDTKDPNADPNQVKLQAMEKAKDVLKQVKDGNDFAKLAAEYSSCPSSQKGGDLGLFGKGRMVPAFEKAAFDLKVGQVSDVVETQFGCHIIKVTEKQEAKTTPFEEAKAQIIQNLNDQNNRQAMQTFIENLKKEANIVYTTKSEAPAPKPVFPMPPK